MTRYDELGQHLASIHTDRWPTTFEEIERVIQAKLPSSAYKYPAWWSNNPSNNTMTQVWLNAGWRTENVDVPGRKLIFRRTSPASDKGMNIRQPSPLPTPDSSPAAKSQENEPVKNIWQRVYGALRGTVHIPEGVDLTAPTGEKWSASE